MNCTVAIVVAFLGAMPAKGVVVIVPRSSLLGYSVVQIIAAKACARRHGIRYVVDEDK